MITVQLVGLDAFMQKVASFAPNAEQEVGNAIERAANELVNIIQNMPPVSSKTTGYDALGIPVAPKYGGTLRQSIHSVRTGVMEAEVKPDTDYADFVHAGTYKMPARPFLEWALNDFGGLQKIEEIVDGATAKII